MASLQMEISEVTKTNQGMEERSKLESGVGGFLTEDGSPWKASFGDVCAET